jgi:hypothetical protein
MNYFNLLQTTMHLMIMKGLIYNYERDITYKGKLQISL